MMELKKRRNAYLMFLLLCLVAAAAIAGMSVLLYQSSTSEQDVAEKNENVQDEAGGELAEGGNAGHGSGTAEADAKDGNDSDGGEKSAEGAAETGGSSLTADNENDGDGASTSNDKNNAADESEAADASANTADAGGNEGAGSEGAGGGNASNMADATGGTDVDGQDSLAAAGQVTESMLAEKIAAYSFEAGKITWPTEGEICLEYNMEHTVYYSTLDLYRCNPGVCISSAVGTAVFAGADGVVTNITEDSFYGTTVTIALGDDYEATYGQLTDVSVSVGDEVKASTQIGQVAEPTIYFTEEGAHLFFELTKNGETADPLDYLNY